MAAQSSLYNEERNLLRIRERERRNQGVLQEKEPLPDQAPLFPEPYKTSKGDELSNRIQSMLGNYEEVKELIGANRNESFIGIPKSVVPSALQSKSDKPNEVSRHSFHSGTHRPIGTSNISSGHRHRPHAETELTAGHLAKSHTSARGQVEDRSTREQQTGSKPMDKSGRRAQECSAEQLSPSSISALSPLLSSLSPPGEPLSPLHSSHEMDSKPQDGQSHEETYSHVNKSPSLYDVGRKDGGSSVTNLLPSTQTFPTSLTSKNNVMPQKPTAYVRPMDGLDQAPNHSPDLKTLQEGYDREPYVTNADLKVKEKLSRSEIPSGQFEDLQKGALGVCLMRPCQKKSPGLFECVWICGDGPLCRTSDLLPARGAREGAARTKRFVGYLIMKSRSFQCLQHTGGKGLSHFKCIHKQEPIMLQDDLQISDSDDSDEGENSEKISSSSVPSSVQQSQADSVVSADSGSVASESSESDSSSDSENESSSSDNEVKQPTRTVSVELSTSSTSIWHLNNWMKPSASTESQSIEDHEQPNHWDSKEQESQKTEPHHKKPTWTSQDEIPNKISHSQSPVPKENITPRQTVGIKQPRKTVKALVTEEPKGGLTVESEPAPYRPRDQPSKEKPTVKTKERTKSNHCKEPKGSSTHTSEKKHKSSRHGGSSKKCLKIQPDKGHSVPPSPQIPPSPKGQSKANHRTSLAHPAVVVCEDVRGDKVLLPIGDRLLQPLSSKPLSLVVRIDLTLLSRLPGICGNISQSKRENGIDQGLYFKKEASETKKLKKQSKEHSKSKVDDCDKNSKKKRIKVESETNAATSRHKELSTEKLPKKSSEKLHKEHRSQKSMSQPGPTQKSAQRHAQKRRPSESSICSQQSTTSSGKSNHKEPSSAKHRRVDEKVSERAKSNKASTENKITPSPVPSLPNGNAKPTRPQLKFEEKLYTSDHYMNEAKKLKHKADAMSSKIGKAFNYLDAAMYFIECGIAMESDVQTPKPAYTMFAETVDLIK
ncbi:Hypothetical predicted protein [Pelobates cultripes]|uniref:AF4/FMR2 C-terminal homology domain-containing protein n=1 Tax=Pelobates cultripes TaxID=61616 RepID=A0AAD1SMM5_PELCU|nr:Hypothetical predicted protein [Pelobates cultripes]